MPKSRLVRIGGGQRESKNASIEGDAGDGQIVRRQEREQAAQGQKSNSHSDHASERGEEKILDPKLAPDMPVRGAEGEARGDLRRAPRHADDGKPGEIGTCDEQDQRGGKHERKRFGAKVCCLPFLQRDGIKGNL